MPEMLAAYRCYCIFLPATHPLLMRVRHEVLGRAPVSLFVGEHLHRAPYQRCELLVRAAHVRRQLLSSEHQSVGVPPRAGKLQEALEVEIGAERGAERRGRRGGWARVGGAVRARGMGEEMRGRVKEAWSIGLDPASGSEARRP